MARIEIEHTLTRNDKNYSVEVRADFWNGEIEDYYTYPKIKLTPSEKDRIEEALMEVYHD